MAYKTIWRPLHRALNVAYPKEVVVHFFLVNTSDEKETKIPCGGVNSLGGLITGNKGQVTCSRCLEAADDLVVDYFA